MQTDMDDLLRRALAVNEDLLALGNEVSEVDGAIFVRNPALTAVHDANHAMRVRVCAPEEIDRLLGRCDEAYGAIGCKHRRFDLDLDTPPEFEARLPLEGYQRNDALVLLLERDLIGEPKPYEIRLVEGDAGWAAYGALHELDWNDYAERTAPGDADKASAWTAAAMLEHRRIKSPPARYWLAYVKDDPRAYLASWEGTGGVGQVEDLFTHADFRHRGLATALIHHCVADARAHGAGPVVIVADPSDTPKQMYAAMGFRPVAVKRSYLKKLS
jgi:GNAT superfamily N-acetyltransferase